MSIAADSGLVSPHIMEDVAFFKQNVELLSALDDATLGRLASEIERKTYKKDHTIMMRGQFSDGLSVIRSGKVVVLARTDPKKKDMVQVAELKPGDYFGEMSLLEDRMAEATLKAGEDGTEILTIPQQPFRVVLEAQPAMKAAIEAKIAARRKK